MLQNSGTKISVAKGTNSSGNNNAANSDSSKIKEEDKSTNKKNVNRNITLKKHRKKEENYKLCIELSNQVKVKYMKLNKDLIIRMANSVSL